MNSPISLFLLLISGFLFVSCSNDSKKEGLLIPPLPIDKEWEQQKATILLLNEEIRSNSNNSENYFKRAKLYFELEKVNEAKSDINIALEINENEGKYRFLKSEILRKLGNINQAYEEAKIAEILGLKSPELFTLIGDLAQKKGADTEAIKYFNIAQKIAPFNGEVYYYQGLLKVKQGDTTSAINYFNKTKLLKPRFIDNYKRLSEIYTNQGNTAMAQTITIDLAKLYPNDAENWTILAKIYKRMNVLDSAIIFYKKAIELKPNMYQASYDGGMLCLKTKSFNEAIKFFENTYKYASKTPFINTFLGMCYENLGNKTKAIEYYTIATAVNQTDFKAFEGLNRLQIQPYYVEPATDGYISKESNININKPKKDTIKVMEIQPRKIVTQKRDSLALKAPIQNKFPLPTIK
jgi:tetratricopeptide (TPR) repeat protein